MERKFIVQIITAFLVIWVGGCTVYQKPRHSVHVRNHLRLWLTPMRFQGKSVWIGQISRDIGVRFTFKTWPPVTHKIDPDIDEAMYGPYRGSYLLSAACQDRLG